MKFRTLGKTGYIVSEISLGTWQLGSKWGEPFDGINALATLEAAYTSGVNLFDTADVYQNGLSEKVIGRFAENKRDRIYVVTKIGRKTSSHNDSSYTADSIRKYVTDSLNNMNMEYLDIVLLHCPPNSVYSKDEVFFELDKLKSEGKIKHYGVSVETISQAMLAINYNISVVEIIFNMMRLKPAEKFFTIAKEKNLGIIARVPLASGLLTGTYTPYKKFSKLDHRSFNRKGESFSAGETFSGVPYSTGITVAGTLMDKLNTDNLTLKALKYILMFDEVSTVIPGASSKEQLLHNVKASDLPDFTKSEMSIVKNVYDEYLRAIVHDLW